MQEALEREKDDLLIQGENMEEELHRIKAELLEVKGSLEMREMRIEELEENLAEQRQTLDLNRTSELGSSGKIIHQGDDLTSLELGSEPGSARFSAADGGTPTKNDLQTEQTIAMLTQENADLREQVEKLRQDLDESVATAGGGRASLEGSVGRGSWGSDQMKTNNRDVEEHLKHVRSIMTQFLTKLPISSKENEDILTIVYSMLNFCKEDIDGITAQRNELANAQGAGKKGGVFGGLINKRK